MKLQKILLTMAAVGLGFLAITIGLQLKHKSDLQSWSEVQMQRLLDLTVLISKYRDTHGHVPETLRLLPDSNTIKQRQFTELQFQSAPEAPPEEWLYFPHGHAEGWILSSATPFVPWDGHGGSHAVAWPDGAREWIPRSKWTSLRQMTDEKR